MKLGVVFPAELFNLAGNGVCVLRARLGQIDLDVERAPDRRKIVERELRPVDRPASLFQQDAAEARAILVARIVRAIDIADGHALGRHGRRQRQHEQCGQKPNHRWPRCAASVRPAPTG